MKPSYTLPLSILMIILPVVPALVDSFPGFLGGAIIDFVLALYVLYSEKPWANDLKTAISTLYFTGLSSIADGFGLFLALPYHPVKFAIITLILSIPFIFNLILVLRPILPTIIKRDILYVGNGFFAFSIVLIIGAIIGRVFITNFYVLLSLYSGFLILAVLALLYFRKG
ncbi:hypothetical protein BFU36_10490 [Sulfolobus sp. A20]|uniref:hypothetical protein n=1 Tax=Sulfolobaceae TaxID=118883 RepID=UPI000845BEC1|nr:MULTISPECIES: hypothetical protein [unclassified Sulfolobus]TRM74325.1 hypothetical protein DJ532_13130 [Sulfolobus sp. A20-N-F8]TRM75663.1 hypothetical protein DJ523_02490 [Sulfolobus sp. E5]TRM79351.1 hypothetical protein DJ528_01730 [Sulfolobus sp. B5]TRM81326.1 hypothetical protein DJ524_04475 [Sulfolobus sp. D5]TRM81466.1 hypothetical protein DJ531_10920 [Sulfolobus sp. A20-N-F6]TRM89399.1 hypothetical protein DJ529_02145 [Sulfolobus sp. C3]TRM98911.1 hypothetical protein DJ530_09830